MSEQDLDLLSAIWVMSANDDNPIITYKGICVRLKNSDEERIRTLVRGRRDLFRLGVRNSILTAWKSDMKRGSHLSGWLSEIEDKKKRNAEIDKLTANDIFRNQFRIADGAPKCDLKTIDWGVQYIERMRAAAAKLREERRTRISTYLSFGSVAVAFLTLALSAWFQFENIKAQSRSLDAQTDLKRYEVTFKPKQEGFAEFMSAVSDSSTAATARNSIALAEALVRLNNKFYVLEPFLGEAPLIEIFTRLANYTEFCVTQSRLPKITFEDKSVVAAMPVSKEYGEYATFFRTHLRAALFVGQ